MTFNAPSFFVGVATVLGLLVVGAGGGYVMSNILLSDGPRPPNKVERQVAAKEMMPTRDAVPVKPAEVAPAAPLALPPAAAVTPPAEPSPGPAPQPVAEPGPPRSTPQQTAPAQQPPSPEQHFAPAQPQVAQPKPRVAPTHERPVALTHPAEAPRLSGREKARIKAQERREERRRLAEEQRRLREDMRDRADRTRRWRNTDDDYDEGAPPRYERRIEFPYFRRF